MATAEQIAEVRLNTNEPNEATFNNAYVSSLIDQSGVDKASSIIWKKKAAKYAELVDVEEAGARQKFSDLMDNAMEMAKMFESGVSAAAPAQRTRVKVIERT